MTEGLRDEETEGQKLSEPSCLCAFVAKKRKSEELTQRKAGEA